MAKASFVRDLKDHVGFRATPAAAAVANTISVVNGRVCVAHDDIAASVEGLYIDRGIWSFPKDATLTITAGDRLYWDATNSELTVEPLGPYAGVAVEDAASTDALVTFELNAVPLGAEGIVGTDLVVFEDDFIGIDAALLKETGSLGKWEDVVVGSATVAAVADENAGAVKLDIEATDEAQDAVLYLGDQLNFDVDKLQKFICRAKAVTPGAGVTIVWGVSGNHNLAKNSVAQHAWFRLDASLALDVESDDGTNDNDDVTTGITLTTNVYYWFMVDTTDPSDVKFYVKTVGATTWTQVATGTTFDVSNYTGGLQPYFSADKASGAVTGSLTIDYVKLVCER